MATTPVRWFHSGMQNAPVLSGTAGALIGLLDDCLLNGFDTRSVNSITVSGGVATVTISAGHAYEQHAAIRLAGVTGALAALNDDWRISAAGASTFTFDCPGLPDGSAAGTITAVRAPSGWAKPFSGTNTAVYQSQSLDATRLFLRVVEAPTYALIRGYEQMTDVDTGTGLFPTTAQQAYYSWGKSSQANTSARDWVVVADDRTLYLLSKFNASYGAALYMFGDAVTFTSADAYHCIIAGHETYGPASPISSFASAYFEASSTNGMPYIARVKSQAAGAVKGSWVASRLSPYSGYSFPAYADGSLYLHAPVLLSDGVGSATYLRGIAPGIMQVMASYTPSAPTIVTPLGRSPVLIASCNTGGSLSLGSVGFDIVGPWR